MAKANWINGSINPPQDGEYYVIQECVEDIDTGRNIIKAGQCEMFSDVFGDGEWESLGAHSPSWKVLCWANILMPDIPKDLQGRVRRYFGMKLEVSENENRD